MDMCLLFRNRQNVALGQLVHDDANGNFIARLEDAGATDLARYPLWLAKWGPKLGTDPSENRIWKNNWTIGQFTADGEIDAVPSSSTDLNVFNGTPEDFQIFINQ